MQKLTANYAALIERVADLEPRGGYHDVSQIILTEDDVRACVEQDEDIISNAFVPVTEYVKKAVLAALASEKPAERYNRFGIMAASAIHNEARVMVLDDVQELCARRSQRQRTLQRAALEGDRGAAAELDGAV